MHSKIIEIVEGLNKPLFKKNWATETSIPEYFVGEIADYADDVGDDIVEDVKASFVKSFGEHCARDGNWITFDVEAKKANAERRYQEFIEKAKLLSTLTLDEFCGITKTLDVEHTVWELNDAFEDKYSTYIFDSTYGEMLPLHKWLRQMRPGECYFMGGVIDYNW